MVAPQFEQMIPIPNPFVGDWRIDQIFQLRVNEFWFAYGYYDIIQDEYIVQIGQDGQHYVVPANFTLRDAIRAACAGALVEHGRFFEADWMQPQDDAPMPPLHDTAALLALTIGWLHRENNAAYFFFQCDMAENPAPLAQE